MTIIFAGGEDSEFTPSSGFCSVSTTAGHRRTTHARCSLQVTDVGGATDGWTCDFAPSTLFWVSTRLNGGIQNLSTATLTTDVIALSIGVNRKLILRSLNQGNGAGGIYSMIKRTDAGTETTLQTSSTKVNVNNVTVKIDIEVNYSVSGFVRVYINGTLIIDYSGDVTTNGSTTLSNATFGIIRASAAYGNYSVNWSEIIIADTPTTSLSLATISPNANGNTFDWTTGATSDISETTLNDATLASSDTANQIAQSTIAASSVITGSVAVAAVVVNARAKKGVSGPANAQLMVRTGATDYTSPNVSLPAALGTVSNAWATNPNTSTLWTASDITNAGFNIGVKSIT